LESPNKNPQKSTGMLITKPCYPETLSVADDPKELSFHSSDVNFITQWSNERGALLHRVYLHDGRRLLIKNDQAILRDIPGAKLITVKRKKLL